jgi:Mn2+/Fe2+ NRAMP family transporter
MKFPPFITKIWLFLLIIGPGIITATAGNDAGGTATYSIVGAHFGYNLLWLLILTTFILIIVQEMCARMGAVTGKGLSDLIREEFGLRWTFIAMAALLVANVAVTISEFAGIAASMEIFGISKYISVPIVAFLIWYLIVRGSFKVVERIFLGVCLIYVSYIFSGFLAKPDWALAFRHTVIPSMEFDPGYIRIMIALIGTTVTPWMQFFLQSNIVEKGVSLKQYGYQRIDTIFGSITAGIIAFFIIVACSATLHKTGIEIHSAKEAGMALRPLAGNFASLLFALGLFGASTLGASILPLSSSYAICEAFGFENGISKRFSEAPIFYSLYTGLIVVGAGVILFPSIPLIFVMLLAQEINGILLPIILVFMMLLINKTKLMGEYTNSRFYNVISWGTIAALVMLTVTLIITSIFPVFS